MTTAPLSQEVELQSVVSTSSSVHASVSASSSSAPSLSSSPSDSTQGLATADVERLRAQHGFNEVKSQEQPLIVKFLLQFWGLSSWLLEACAVASFALLDWVNGTIPLVLLVINACLGFNEDRKTNEAMKALQSQLQILVRVRRDGQWQSVPARELVPGDVLKLRSGDVIAADTVHLEGTPLLVDQSALTGESLATEVKVGGDLYAGSVIRLGEALTRVGAIGLKTKFGKTVGLLDQSKPKLHSEVLTHPLCFLFSFSFAVSCSFSFYSRSFDNESIFDEGSEQFVQETMISRKGLKNNESRTGHNTSRGKTYPSILLPLALFFFSFRSYCDGLSSLT